MSKQIFVNSLILSFGILLGRFSGYVRELVIAYKFDVSSNADNIILMLTVPDLLNNLLVSGAVSGVLIPLLSNNNTKVLDIINDFTQKLFMVTVWLYIVLISILFFVFDFYIYSLLVISLFSVFPNIFTFISSSYLQYEKRFKKQSLNTLIFNIVIIGFLLIELLEYYFAIGVIIASIVRMMWVVSDIKYTNINFSINSLLKFSNMNYIRYNILIFMILANGLIFILPVIDKIFASFLEEGSVAILSYSEKIYLLPVSVFLTTYAVAMFPDLSRMVAGGEFLNVNKILKKALGFNILASFIVVFIIYVFSVDITTLLYGVVGLEINNILIISNTLNHYLGALLLAGSNAILLNIFFAHKWYNVLMVYSGIVLFVKVLINSFILYYEYDIELIAFGTSVTMLFSVILLLSIYVIKNRKVR